MSQGDRKARKQAIYEEPKEPKAGCASSIISSKTRSGPKSRTLGRYASPTTSVVSFPTNSPANYTPFCVPPTRAESRAAKPPAAQTSSSNIYIVPSLVRMPRAAIHAYQSDTSYSGGNPAKLQARREKLQHSRSLPSPTPSLLPPLPFQYLYSARSVLLHL
jgi:hypothetical protein